MKRTAAILAFVLSLMLTAPAASAQRGKPQVKWSAEAVKVDKGSFDIVIRAEIPEHYHMYALEGIDGAGDIPTVIRVSADGAVLSGAVSARTEHTRHFEPVFGYEQSWYEGDAEFVQRVDLRSRKAKVRIETEYMICTDGGCIPPDDWSCELVLKGKPAKAAAVAADGSSASASVSGDDARASEGQDGAVASGDGSAVSAASASSASARKSLWALILEAIAWGFAALLTPCVFPMVPMTVSYFLKGSSNAALGRARAGLYGLFIVLLYTVPIAVIILVTRILGGAAVTADIFNWLATHWLPNIIFFVVFMIFAASFLGAFEIVLPSKLVNKSDAKADTKGVGGIFFLALTLVLVSFSCTGPIVGSVLIKSTSGEFWAPIVTMFAFSLAFSLPFVLLALFPGLLKKMPRSGGWLGTVKVVIAFIEIALGLKFLSVADQTYHWGILDREVYLAIWIVVFGLLGLYLLGKLTFSHEEKVEKIGVGRFSLAVIVLAFTVYLIPGMWGAPLKALSGYLPPITTQDFVLGGPGGAAASVEKAPASSVRKYSDFLKLPLGIDGFFDLAEAREYAEAAGKPIFVDFTGHGCVNCREMESRVWSDPRVLKMLKEDFVVCALYADDKKELPESDWVVTSEGKTLKSLGKINSYYALTQYEANAQPCYVLEAADGTRLGGPRGYNLDVESFIEFLSAALDAFRPTVFTAPTEGL